MYFKYNDFEFIKSITNFNEVIDEYENETYLHDICYNYYNLEIIKYCIKKGADLNINDIDNWTPFHWICYKYPSKKNIRILS